MKFLKSLPVVRAVAEVRFKHFSVGLSALMLASCLSGFGAQSTSPSPAPDQSSPGEMSAPSSPPELGSLAPQTKSEKPISYTDFLSVILGKMHLEYQIELLKSEDPTSPEHADELELAMRSLERELYSPQSVTAHCYETAEQLHGCWEALDVLAGAFDETVILSDYKATALSLNSELVLVKTVGNPRRTPFFEFWHFKKNPRQVTLRSELSELRKKSVEAMVYKRSSIRALHQKLKDTHLPSQRLGMLLDWDYFFNHYYHRLLNDAKFSGKEKNDFYLGSLSRFLNNQDIFSDIELRSRFEKAREDVDAGHSFVGIGVTIESLGGFVEVKELIPGGGALSAGVQVGDLLISVNQESIKNWPIERVVSQLTGAEGTQVLVGIQRGLESFSVSIPRKKITQKNMTLSYLTSQVAMIKLIKFDGEPEAFMKQWMSYLTQVQQSSEVQTLVVDLRSNLGGNVALVLGMLSSVLQKNHRSPLLLTEKSAFPELPRGLPSYHVIPKFRTSFDKQLIVLVNANSASASEIFAGLVQYTQSGWVVGQNTFGKGSVQTLLPMGEGEGLVFKATTSHYYFPNHRSPHLVGIQPDIPVAAQGDVEAFRLAQLYPNEPGLEQAPWQDPRAPQVNKLRACVSNIKDERIPNYKQLDPELRAALKLVPCLQP